MKNVFVKDNWNNGNEYAVGVLLMLICATVVICSVVSMVK